MPKLPKTKVRPAVFDPANYPERMEVVCLELRPTNRQIEKELQADLKHEQKEALRFLDGWILSVAKIETIKLRLRRMGSYVLPDGITK